MPSILKPKDVAGSIMAKRKPSGGLDFQSEQDGAPEDEMSANDQPDASDGDEGLSSAAHDLMTAIHANDPEGVASAFKAAFQILESQPHEEGGEEGEEEEQPPGEGQEQQ